MNDLTSESERPHLNDLTSFFEQSNSAANCKRSLSTMRPSNQPERSLQRYVCPFQLEVSLLWVQDLLPTLSHSSLFDPQTSLMPSAVVCLCMIAGLNNNTAKMLVSSPISFSINSDSSPVFLSLSPLILSTTPARLALERPPHLDNNAQPPIDAISTGRAEHLGQRWSNNSGILPTYFWGGIYINATTTVISTSSGADNHTRASRMMLPMWVDPSAGAAQQQIVSRVST